MAAMAQLRCSSFLNDPHYHKYNAPSTMSPSSSPYPSLSFKSQNRSLSLLQTNLSSQKKSHLSFAGGDGGNGVGHGGKGGGGGNGGDHSGGESDAGDDGSRFGILCLFLNGWRSRVAADPQFPFKVLMEELVGVSSCVLGDMASRPNFGLNELDFVFSTLVVGSILNFTLMYLLAPTLTMSSSSKSLVPAIFANCPKSHMFEPGPYGPLHRLGTFVYKGIIFAAVGFGAGLVGTILSNGLIKIRKKMDPDFKTPNKAPPTLLNALTWATHMGLSSNFRYQTLNGIEYALAKGLPPLAFKSSVVVLRCLNNVLGGMSFVALARLSGSQQSGAHQSKPGGVVAVEEADKGLWKN